MKRFMLACLISLFVFSANVNAAPSGDKYATETYAATVMTYQMLLNGLEIIKSDPPGSDIVITHQEPAICWPFPIEFQVFYRVIQDGVNDRVNALPKRDRGKAGTLVGWYVWNTVQREFGC